MPISNHSLWRAKTNDTLLHSPLNGDVHTDVVIIGGGYSGLSAALHLAQQGAAVHVLEACTIGHGGSGRNVGLVNAGLWTPPDEVEAILGQQAGNKLNAALATAPDLVFSLIQQHQIECHPLRNGTLHCATNRCGLRQLKQRYAQQLKRNAPVSLLGPDTTKQRTGSSQFLGALFDPRAGTLQPLSYAIGLAHAAVKAGAVIHTHSPALTYQQSQKKTQKWIVTTDNGSITANKLIHATNAYNTPSADNAHFTTVNYAQFATHPLTAKQRRTILPNGEGCWDTNQVMSSFRMDDSGRLIIGGVGSLDGNTKQIHINWAHRQVKALFPHVTEYEFEYMWSGRIAMTADHLPKITRLGDNGIRLYGYSGRGIGPATVFGKEAATWAITGNEDGLPVAITIQKKETFTGLKAAYFNMGATLNHLTTRRLGPF
jgi:glycine/D-amino acid oxidase-like deaminating enzyme